MFGAGSLLVGAGLKQVRAANHAPAVIMAQASRAQIPCDVKSGDINADSGSAVIAMRGSWMQWDDHETRNNGYPDRRIGTQEARCQMRSASQLRWWKQALLGQRRPKFSEFKPFWKFVGGPLNAGTFGP